MLVDASSPRRHVHRAEPAGPWTYAGDIATTPRRLRSYGAQTPFGLQGAPPPMLVHSINVEEGVPLTINNYGFRFVDVTLPPAFDRDDRDRDPGAAAEHEPSTTTSSSTTTTTSTSTTTTTTSAPSP